jgi:hypothetical protein
MGGEFIGDDHYWLDTFLDAIPYLLCFGGLLGWAHFLFSPRLLTYLCLGLL